VKSIAEAINEVTDDEVLDDDDATEEGEEEGQSSLLDEEDAADDESEEGEAESEEDKPRGDVVGEEAEEGSEAAATDDEPDQFDTLTAEEIAGIKADPALNKLRKQLMRGYSVKTAELSQLVQLGQAYQKNPTGVLRAMAQHLGLQIYDQAAPPPAVAAPAAPVDPGKELEDLFGPQIGPKVRAVFDKWAEARIGGVVAPVRDTLGRVVSLNEAARMQAEEQSFKTRHKGITPQIEAEIVALGNSGKIVPGDMSPSEYLDTLHDVVMARRARASAKVAGKAASVKLASRIEANRRDREPVGVSGRGGSVKKVSRIPEARSISEALDFAMAELTDER
jgi:hypothetical protein